MFLEFLIGIWITYNIALWIWHKIFPVPTINPAGRWVFITGCDTGCAAVVTQRFEKLSFRSFGNMLAKQLDKAGYSVFAGALRVS